MSGSGATPRLVVGPRRAGRDYDVLAASPGLALAAADLSLVQQHNFEVRRFVREDHPVRAFFPLRASGDDLWLLATTSLNGEAAGNPIWVTHALVLDPSILSALDSRVLHLASCWIGDAPELGSELDPAPITPPPAASSAATNARWVEACMRLLESSRLAVEAPGDNSIPLLKAILDAAPAWRRRTLSFITAPPDAVSNASDIDLAVVEAGLLKTRTLVSGHQVLLQSDMDAATASEVNTIGGWEALLDSAAKEHFSIASGLDEVARSLPSAPAESSEAEIVRRVDAYLDRLANDGARIEALFHLVRAARTIRPQARRAEIIRALLKAFETRMKASPDPASWLVQYLQKVHAVIGPDGPRLLPARLAVETGVIFALPASFAVQLAPAVMKSLADQAHAQLGVASRRSSGALATLLNAAAEAHASGDGHETAARFGEALVGALSTMDFASARAEGVDPSAAITAFVAGAFAADRRRDLGRMRRSGVLRALKRSEAAKGIDAVFTHEVRAARARPLPKRADLAAALAVWRSGRAWEAA